MKSNRELAKEITITATGRADRSVIGKVETLLNKERPERKFEDWDRLTMQEEEIAKLKKQIKELGATVEGEDDRIKNLRRMEAKEED